jgi:superfamily II DNA or RNA helicase
LPDAKIGIIQGQIIDIENKDIVIGMLQSLSGKEYPQNMFESFGFTIIDENHHISSEIFSRALQKIVTPVMLGLSATMQRKDGLTRVFKMFLGDIVFKMKRENDDEVLVKAIEYQTDDKDFNEVQIDWKGQVAYSTMVSKICSFNHRTEFIIKVIKNELEENPNQQIMVLGSQKDILVYIYKAIEHRNIASVGYYVGGMKEKDLKLSETKKVVVATYAMAAEGLDIKTLSTLFLVTPRTDITQAVGRILRVKHERPLVVDIIDNHDVFKRQWMKRKAFYKKNKYKIISTNSNLYESDTWTILYDNNSKIDTIIKNDEEIPKGKCLIKF